MFDDLGLRLNNFFDFLGDVGDNFGRTIFDSFVDSINSLVDFVDILEEFVDLVGHVDDSLIVGLDSLDILGAIDRGFNLNDAVDDLGDHGFGDLDLASHLFSDNGDSSGSSVDSGELLDNIVNLVKLGLGDSDNFFKVDNFISDIDLFNFLDSMNLLD